MPLDIYAHTLVLPAADATDQELVVVANESFFQRRQAAAVLKHGILSRYQRMFATMAGKRTGRVVYFDGYAGPGRYDDGSPGSPLLAVETARATAKWDREVECLFVEKDPAHAANPTDEPAMHRSEEPAKCS